MRLDIACVLDEADNCLLAAEVKWTLDNLIAAYNARLDLEDKHNYSYGRRWLGVPKHAGYQTIKCESQVKFVQLVAVK